MATPGCLSATTAVKLKRERRSVESAEARSVEVLYFRRMGSLLRDVVWRCHPSISVAAVCPVMSAAPAALLLNFRLRRLRRKAASVAVSIGDDIWRTSGGTPKRGGSEISSLPEPVTAELDACFFFLFDMEFCEARVQDCRRCGERSTTAPHRLVFFPKSELLE